MSTEWFTTEPNGRTSPISHGGWDLAVYRSQSVKYIKKRFNQE